MQRWLQIDIHADDGVLRAQVSSSSGGRSTPPQRLEGLTPVALEAFAAAAARAGAAHRPLPAALQAQARALFSSLFSGEIARVFDQLRGEALADRGRILVRLMLPAPGLQAVPWEAMRGPSAVDGELALHPELALVRGVFSSSPSIPREVTGPVRLLVIAPEADASMLEDLRRSLADAIDAGQLEWLEPVAGLEARWRFLMQRLQRPPRPHVIHFIGHGRVNAGMPELKLAGGDGMPELKLAGDDDTWVTAELFSSALAATVLHELRLVYLESCAGGSPGALASAAERIAARGIDGVIAHLWPIAADTARLTARSFYATLTGTGERAGDVAACLATARLTVAGELGSAEFLSPLLFLRGTDPRLFDFRGRRLVAPPRPGPAGSSRQALDDQASLRLNELLELLKARPTLLVGEHIDPDGTRLGLHQLKRELETHLEDEDPASLFSMLQRYEFYQNREELKDFFQLTLDPLTRDLVPPFLEELGTLTRLCGPGMFLTLLWLPLLELALAHNHPDRRILVYQPLEPGGLDRLRAFVREPRDTRWQRLREAPTRPDFARDFVVLRLYGGYSPESHALFGDPVLTEDNQLEGLSVIDTLPSHLLATLRSNPMLILGLCPSEWSHRELLRRVLGGQPLSASSMAVLRRGAKGSERRFWESRSGPAGRAGGVRVWRFDELAMALRAGE